MERRGKRERERRGVAEGVTAGRRGSKSESSQPCVMLRLAIRFLVGREAGEMIRYIYQADLSGAAAATARRGIPLIWCLTSSQSGCVSANKYIHYFLTLTHCISSENIKWKEERGRARNDRLTVQKKNAVCCRKGEKVPEGERQTCRL